MQSSLKQIAASSVFAFCLTGCTVDPTKVEGSIRDHFKKDGIEIKAISCPSDQKIKKDAAFDCSGTSSEGDDFKVHVKITDSQGTVSWELDGKVMDPKVYAATLAEKLPGEFDCGTKKFIAVKGTKMVCKFKGKEATIVFKNDEGEVDASEFGRVFATTMAQ